MPEVNMKVSKREREKEVKRERERREVERKRLKGYLFSQETQYISYCHSNHNNIKLIYLFSPRNVASNCLIKGFTSCAKNCM